MRNLLSLFLLLLMAGSLPAFPATSCYLAHFSSYPDGCVCYTVDEFSAFFFVYDPNDPSYNDDISYCHSNLASQDVVFDCSVDGSSVSCTRISDNTGSFSLPPSLSCSTNPCTLPFSGAGGATFSCREVYDLSQAFLSIREGFFRVLVGVSFALGLLGGAYAVLRVRFGS